MFNALQGSRRQWSRFVHTRVLRRVHQYALYKQRKAERAAEGVRREVQGDPGYDESSFEEDIAFWAEYVAGRPGSEADAAEAAVFSKATAAITSKAVAAPSAAPAEASSSATTAVLSGSAMSNLVLSEAEKRLAELKELLDNLQEQAETEAAVTELGPKRGDAHRTARRS